MGQTVLLATFINDRKKVSSVLKIIAKNFEVRNDKVFLLRDVNSDNDFILSFNVKEKDIVFSDIIRNTISLHRKKETNTLYTLNALNELVMLQNDGVLNESFPVNWDDYNECIILTQYNDNEEEDCGEFQLKKIDTKLVKVFTLRKE